MLVLVRQVDTGRASYGYLSRSLLLKLGLASALKALLAQFLSCATQM